MDSEMNVAKRALASVTLGDVFFEFTQGVQAAWQTSVVTGISEDSREIKKGFVFVARDGEHFKGTDYIEQAINLGAVAIVVEKNDKGLTYDLESYSVPVFAIADLSFNVGKIASKVFGNVVSQLNIIGITGTNGKTSCAHYIAQALNELGQPTFMIGTLGNGHPDRLCEAERTTPDACQLQSLFADYYQQGVCNVVMEVSSHALQQGRVEGTPFKVAAYTNLSRDHLDYHETMQDYAQAKSRLFTDFDVTHRILNADDEYNQQLANILAVEAIDSERANLVGSSIIHYSEKTHHFANANLVAKNIKLDKGLAFALEFKGIENQNVKLIKEEVQVDTQLIGQFNIANLLLVSSVLCCLGLTARQIQQSLKCLKPVPGRMQSIRLFNDTPREKRNSKMHHPLSIVDYAHTPDALEKVLLASRVHCSARLFLVFGCGGDRDIGKRVEMAKKAEQFADVIIVTSDNPRTESPESIIGMIENGFSSNTQFLSLSDRKKAISKAVEMANERDVILVAGKGHENYQEIMGIKHKFSDADVVMSALREQQQCQLINNESTYSKEGEI